MKEYEIRDIALAPQGHQKIEWVRAHMPLLRGLEEEFTRTRPFEGVKISLSVHLEAKTAYLCKVLAAGGAQMSITGSNPLSTKDEIAAALAVSEGTVKSRINRAKARLKEILSGGGNLSAAASVKTAGEEGQR